MHLLVATTCLFSGLFCIFIELEMCLNMSMLWLIAQFRLGVAGLGNKEPRLGHICQPFCPVCPTNPGNCEQHLVCDRSSVYLKLADTGITTIITQCLSKGFVMEYLYGLFVAGLDCERKPIPFAEYLECWQSLHDLRQCLLQKWWFIYDGDYFL